MATCYALRMMNETPDLAETARVTDIVWSLRHWVRIWRGHHGRLAPEVDFEVLALAADEITALRDRVAELEAGETRTEWEYGVQRSSGSTVKHRSHAYAREAVRLADGTVVQRRAPGPWVPVEEDDAPGDQ